MTIAGLPNVSTFGPQLFSEPQFPISRQFDDDTARPSTPASTLLQMWRELEGEHAASPSYRQRQQRNRLVSECLSTSSLSRQGSTSGDVMSQYSDESENQGCTGNETENEDNDRGMSEQSSDLGGIERERVRQIFQEWAKSGSRGHGYHLNNRSRQWLGEKERERVRIIREWVQMTAQHRISCDSPRDGAAEVVSQIDALDGLATTQLEIGAQRPIRRLCGRQTLLDLILRAQSERMNELRVLLEQRPVSAFAHRSRIQALLRGKFLRDGRVPLDERPSSAAVKELGLLRQRSTVSNLREGILSKLDASDNSASTSTSWSESRSSSSDENYTELTSPCRENEVTENHTSSDLESPGDGNQNQKELKVQSPEAEDPVLVFKKTEKEVSLAPGSASSCEKSTLDIDAGQEETFSNSEDGAEIDTMTFNELSIEPEELYSGRPFQILDGDYERRHDGSYPHGGDGHTSDLEGNTNEEFDSLDASAHVEEFQESMIATEDSLQQINTAPFSERSLETFDNSDVEQYQAQESHETLTSHNAQEAIDDWLDVPIGRGSTPLERTDTLDFPDDDNVRSMELRELFSRRRVSNLLGGSFREILDLVLQSHADRLGHVSSEYEFEESSSATTSIEHDQEQLNRHQTLAFSGGAERNPLASISAIWDEELLSANWQQHYSNQQFQTEWEVINGLRVDMARLHQTMNNMQSMLETCMEMQVELQRAVRQEVSAALNRPTSTRHESSSDMLDNESHLDYVRKGICCLCENSKIDSLLYRCGHMCSCSKCAQNLVDRMGKCPMCKSPVVEVVPAYLSKCPRT